MAEKEFDFKELSECKLAVYKKQYCKPAVVKKAKGAIIMLDYKLSGKKIPCVIITFKKPAEAKKVFKDLKMNKEHVLKKTGLCKVDIGKDDGGYPQITVDILKGGLSPEALIKKGADLFDNTLKMKLIVKGGKEEEIQEIEEEETSDANGQVDTNEDTIAKDQKKTLRSAKIKKMNENISKMDEALGSVPKEKLNANVEKYEAALAELIHEAQADGEIDDDEQAEIDELENALDELKSNIEKLDNGKAKKMTPERKAKIKENMIKINARLEAITKKLGL
jgi:hypothetical protein